MVSELKRYWAVNGPIKEAADGEYVRFSDVQAHTQAAVAAALKLAALAARKAMVAHKDADELTCTLCAEEIRKLIDIPAEVSLEAYVTAALFDQARHERRCVMDPVIALAFAFFAAGLVLGIALMKGGK